MQLLQAVHIQLPDVVCAAHCIIVKGRLLVMTLHHRIVQRDLERAYIGERSEIVYAREE